LQQHFLQQQLEQQQQLLRAASISALQPLQQR
jgi:hypothetical protein